MYYMTHMTLMTRCVDGRGLHILITLIFIHSIQVSHVFDSMREDDWHQARALESNTDESKEEREAREHQVK